jgi:hypothetical protein
MPYLCYVKFKQISYMRTNAKSKTVLEAVLNVSSSKYNKNVVFRTNPIMIKKGVVHFTLRTIDKMGLGSLISSDGRNQPRANQNVYNDVKNEIFRLEQNPKIFVDNDFNLIVDSSIKRKYSQSNELVLSRFTKLIGKMNEYVQKHPELVTH